MIITRTPYRISFVGGGSDMAAFFHQEAGCAVSATIDKYITIAVNRKYDGQVRVSYSRTENVARAADVQHPLVRACLSLANIQRGIEIVSIGDIPSGTGLGSSSAFTVGLLHALYSLQGEFHTADSLAASACHAEIELSRSPIGKQDQYAAAFGGFKCYTFHTDGRVGVEALCVDTAELESYLLLLDTTLRRDANVLLAAQQSAMQDSRKLSDVRAMANLAHAFRDALLAGKIEECGEIMDAAWRHKRALGATSDQIDGWYTRARQAGAWGGKLCGAGGGGFLLFLAPPERHGHIRHALQLRSVPFRLSAEGSTVIYGGAP